MNIQKKIRLSAVTASILAAGALVCSAAHAQTENGVYIQGDVGVSNLKFDDGSRFRANEAYRELKDSYRKSGVMPRLSVGVRDGNWRFAADYTLYRKIDERAGGSIANTSAKVTASGIGASAMYDFMEGSFLRPYIGARVSANRVDYEFRGSLLGNTSSSSEEKTRLGYGVLLGVGFDLTDRMTVDVGYRYSRIASDLNAQEASVGLRYTF